METQQWAEDERQKVVEEEEARRVAQEQHTGGKDPNTQWRHAEYIVITVFK